MPTANTKASQEARIRELLEGWANALRAKEADRVMSHYAVDLVQFDLAPPLKYAGGNALYKTLLEKWFASFEGPIGYEIRDLSITASDAVAFCHSLNHLSGTKTAGEEVDLWLRSTVCLRRIDGNWAIAHGHESVPYYMDGSYKAAVDLKP